MRWLELRVPPLALVILAAGLMWPAAQWLPAFRLPFYGHQAVALLVLLAGIFMSIAGVVQFRRARTTVNPLTPQASSSLVVDGVYRWTRNPMYLGFLAILAAWAVFLASLASAIVLPWFVLYMNHFQIVPEERALAARFGPAFEEYRRSVRRWL